MLRLFIAYVKSLFTPTLTPSHVFVPRNRAERRAGHRLY